MDSKDLHLRAAHSASSILNLANARFSPDASQTCVAGAPKVIVAHPAKREKPAMSPRRRCSRRGSHADLQVGGSSASSGHNALANGSQICPP